MTTMNPSKRASRRPPPLVSAISFYYTRRTRLKRSTSGRGGESECDKQQRNTPKSKCGRRLLVLKMREIATTMTRRRLKGVAHKCIRARRARRARTLTASVLQVCA